MIDSFDKKVYIGIGGNMPGSLEAFRKAINLMDPWLHSIRKASLYKTKPLIDIDQPDFLNSAISGMTNLSPFDLLRNLQQVELQLGRQRDILRPKGPRIIDLDMLLFENFIISAPQLKIPHAAMQDRFFVLVPLLELNPTLEDPQTKIKYSQYRTKLSDQGVYLYQRSW